MGNVGKRLRTALLDARAVIVIIVVPLSRSPNDQDLTKVQISQFSRSSSYHDLTAIKISQTLTSMDHIDYRGNSESKSVKFNMYFSIFGSPIGAPKWIVRAWLMRLPPTRLWLRLETFPPEWLSSCGLPWLGPPRHPTFPEKLQSGIPPELLHPRAGRRRSWPACRSSSPCSGCPSSFSRTRQGLESNP